MGLFSHAGTAYVSISTFWSAVKKNRAMAVSHAPRIIHDLSPVYASFSSPRRGSRKGQCAARRWILAATPRPSFICTDHHHSCAHSPMSAAPYTVIR